MNMVLEDYDMYSNTIMLFEHDVTITGFLTYLLHLSDCFCLKFFFVDFDCYTFFKRRNAFV